MEFGLQFTTIHGKFTFLTTQRKKPTWQKKHSHTFTNRIKISQLVDRPDDNENENEIEQIHNTEKWSMNNFN